MGTNFIFFNNGTINHKLQMQYYISYIDKTQAITLKRKKKDERNLPKENP